MVDISNKLHYSSIFFSLNLLLFLSNPDSLLATTSILEENPHVIDINDLQTYIVHVEPCPHDNYSQTLTAEEARVRWYKSFLPVDSGESRLIYSYHHASTGFAARLTKEEFAEMEKKPGFLHADLDQVLELQTTHTPQFLGLDPPTRTGLWTSSNFGQGLIIGVLDTGIDEDHPSFKPKGNTPPPPPATKWKGKCEFTGMRTCNNKLLGARSFASGLNAIQGKSLGSPKDTDSHGTHVAGIATGMFVANANLETQANGTAAGTAPYAYLAVYRVCNSKGCANSDVLAGMDAAIGDGVDVINLSLGSPSQGKYYKSAVAKGAYRAIKKGIFVSAAAGNEGSDPSTISNEAPWLLTVGASTMDRQIRTTVILDAQKQQQQFNGESAYQPIGYSSPFLPLVNARSEYAHAADCNSSLDDKSKINVVGKIVVCEVGGGTNNIEKGRMVKKAGGAAMILVNPPTCDTTTTPDLHDLPASHVGFQDGWKIKEYIRDSQSPDASINFKGTVIGNSIVAPVMACFSSRGPSLSDPNILKPDIIGPGVNVFAAIPFSIGKPGSKYYFLSGTSMATPHLSGIATLLKVTHPNWSPAAIKSAIMTTAYTIANNGQSIMDDDMQNPANYFAMGAGHVDPTAANNPGLIYDIASEDYIPYLCGLQYSDREVMAIVDEINIRCSNYGPISGTELNLPSFAVTLKGRNRVTVMRTVTNVGPTDSTYRVQITQPPQGATVTVTPTVLTFSTANNVANYAVTFTRIGAPQLEKTYEAQLAWVSGSTKVVSPIVIKVSTTTSCSIQSM